MSVRVPQSRYSAGCYWFVAAGFAAVTWLWSFLPGGAPTREQLITDCVIFGLLVILAVYFTFERKRFADAVFVMDSAPAPGRTLRGRVETPLTGAPIVTLSLEAVTATGARRTSVVWRTQATAIAAQGVAPIEVAIPEEVANDPRTPRKWLLSLRARVPLGFYRATFVIDEAA